MYGILFDLDGTLVDSDPIHFEAWQKILAEIKPNQPLIDREFFDKNISGRLNADITREFLSYLSEDEQEKLADKKELLFRELAKEKLQPTKGLDKILEYIKENRSKLKIGLATNAPRLIVEFELGLLKLDEKSFFDAVLLAEEFGIGKPNPDIYLELARRLNVDKNSCVIFEDSISGVRAAVAAEIKCIGILTSAKKETLEQYGTWRTVKNFQDINLDEIWNAIQ
ncbi:unnamed protein product [Rotaria sordida]|uniref:Beta-phosphoglucomutase n=1 Tax=Rotaria sordida TaxID=392033 RepID=A0A814R9U0_9BILA|nr:unnamed protein product [Rotaria sordida]CAF1130999.1 unnamed protein product [Rotaria sordida]CAF1353800.1 unnamed protein product [Rotaria sordida]CAF3761488.1 unnamed protein product [Rotaria sordida]